MWGVIGLLVNVDRVVAELHERLEFPFLEVKLDIVVDCKKYQKHLLCITVNTIFLGFHTFDMEDETL